MKLSDAIRKGCEGTEQEFGFLFSVSENGNCALGAAIRGAGINRIDTSGISKAETSLLVELNMACEEALFGKTASCFECGYAANVATVIMHINDYHKVSREAIAEWVEATLETGARIVEKEAPAEVVKTETLELVNQ